MTLKQRRSAILFILSIAMLMLMIYPKRYVVLIKRPDNIFLVHNENEASVFIHEDVTGWSGSAAQDLLRNAIGFTKVVKIGSKLIIFHIKNGVVSKFEYPGINGGDVFMLNGKIYYFVNEYQENTNEVASNQLWEYESGHMIPIEEDKALSLMNAASLGGNRGFNSTYGWTYASNTDLTETTPPLRPSKNTPFTLENQHYNFVMEQEPDRTKTRWQVFKLIGPNLLKSGLEMYSWRYEQKYIDGKLFNSIR